MMTWHWGESNAGELGAAPRRYSEAAEACYAKLGGFAQPKLRLRLSRPANKQMYRSPKSKTSAT